MFTKSAIEKSAVVLTRTRRRAIRYGFAVGCFWVRASSSDDNRGNAAWSARSVASSAAGTCPSRSRRFSARKRSRSTVLACANASSRRRAIVSCRCNAKTTPTAATSAASMITSLKDRRRFIRSGFNTSKLASAWLGCSRERERVDDGEPPLAHARGYAGNEMVGSRLAPEWSGRMPEGILFERGNAFGAQFNEAGQAWRRPCHRHPVPEQRSLGRAMRSGARASLRRYSSSHPGS